jgi:hypothetical protein
VLNLLWGFTIIAYFAEPRPTCVIMTAALVFGRVLATSSKKQIAGELKLNLVVTLQLHVFVMIQSSQIAWIRGLPS